MFTKIRKLTVLSCILLSPISMAGSIEDIKEKGEVGLCAHPSQMPFSNKGDRPEGFQVDIAQAISEKLDVPLNVSWIFSRRQAKKVGCDFYAGVAKLGDSDSKFMLVSNPFLRLEFHIVTLAGKPEIKSVNDLKPLTVGSMPGSVASRALYRNDIDVAVRFSDEESRLKALAEGLIDAAIVTNVSSGWFQKKYGHELQVFDAEKVLNAQLNYDYALGIRKADENTRAIFNQALVDMQNDGTLAGIFSEYGFITNK